MNTEKTAVLFGPYQAPALKVGDHASCLYRDAEVVVYGWNDARIACPICYIAGTRAFGKGILVEEELGRAIRQESATALSHWWGISGATVRKWRAALGIGRMDSAGSRRLIHNAALGGLNARRKYAPRKVRLWSADELAMLGVLPDDEVARRTRRTVKAVATTRRDLGVPAV